MKPTLVISCPASSRSGYGDHSRDIIYSLLKLDKYNVSILDQPWGNCPRTELANHLEIAIRCIPNITFRPDIWVQITVPNEFTPVGKYNVGITAGIETTLAAGPWIQGCNNMNLVLVPSQHAKSVFEASNWEMRDSNTQQVTGELKLEVPVEVLHEGLDLEIYNKSHDTDPEVDAFMSQIKEKFCFLFVGHWLKGDPGHDRKNIARMLNLFTEAFKNKASRNRPALIVKTGMSGFSRVDEYELIKRIKQYTGKNGPKVYLLHGDLTPDQMSALYNHSKVKSMISFTKGEGYGRPLLEFSVTGKPVICSNWSGHLDFMSEHGVLVPGQLNQVHASAVWENVIVPESAWFDIDPTVAAQLMQSVHSDYKSYLSRSAKQTKYVKDNFSIDKVTEDLSDIVDKYFVVEQQLELPTLNLEPLALPEL